jgi:TolB protein
MKKRHSLFLVLIFPLFAISTPALRAVEAKVYIDIDSPAGRKLPIAIQEFIDIGTLPGEEEMVGPAREELMDALKGDFDFSGLLDIIEKDAYLEEPSEKGFSLQGIKFGLWRVIGAELLINGGLKIEDKKLTVEVHLFDAVTEVQLLAKRYVGKVENPRTISHRFADDVMQELTGKRGVFSTKLLFVSDRTGAKEIYMSDYDGRNPKRITNDRSINLSPRWSPDGDKVLYTSYMQGGPTLYEQELVTRKVRKVSDRPGINIGGRWSPDGRRVALTLSVDRSPELYILELDSMKYTRLTNNYGIDVSPTWSPDGERLAYISNMAGNPHIYMITSDGGRPKRLTYEGLYHSTPSWSPDGKKIAFARLLDGRFNIWVMNPDGTGKAQLTFEGNNKSPSWSPDGRYIVFSSSGRKGSGGTSIYIMRADGGGLKKITTGGSNERSPVWSPYLR